jgi:hypothetical protein
MRDDNALTTHLITPAPYTKHYPMSPWRVIKKHGCVRSLGMVEALQSFGAGAEAEDRAEACLTDTSLVTGHATALDFELGYGEWG